MDSRKQQLLNLVIDNHIATAEPVGSRFLLSSGKMDIGEATIRNELRTLEEEGYLTHPHTSAGRIPTAKGYRHYTNIIDKNRVKVSKKDNNILGLAVKSESDYFKSRKNLSKKLAEVSNQAVILAFSPDSVYYTGLSNLFSQPEFQQLELVTDVSAVFDHCDNCLDAFFEEINDDLQILVSNDHPLGDMLSILVTKFDNDQGEKGLIALMGPLRMDYKKNYGLMVKIKELI